MSESTANVYESFAGEVVKKFVLSDGLKGVIDKFRTCWRERNDSCMAAGS